MSIYKKLLEIQEEAIGLSKDAKNPFFKSKYITLDNIIETFNPILSDKNIVVLHRTENKEIVTQLVDTDDDKIIESRFPLIESNDPQKLGSCITYAKRYNLGQLLNIKTDEDDDGNTASGNTLKKSANKTDIMDYITRIKEEQDVNVLNTIYKETEKENYSQKQKDWIVKECKERKEYLLANQ